jgi:hypothetical protein
MMRRSKGSVGLGMDIPLGFKIWFAFVACLMVGFAVVTGLLVYSVISAGPEGIGREVGRIMKGIEDGRR